MYSVSTFFRLIQYKREGMQLHFQLVCLKLVFVHFSSVIYILQVYMWFLKYSGKNIRSASGFWRQNSSKVWDTEVNNTGETFTIFLGLCIYLFPEETKPRVIVAALPSCMMLFDLETKLLRYSRRDFLEKIDVRTEIPAFRKNGTTTIWIWKHWNNFMVNNC
jgi:hypothetical protein